MSVNYKPVRIPQTHSQMKSIVNLSYNKKDTITPNLIIPVMCERTIAGDVWNLKLTGFLRWLYLKVPSLDTLKLSLNVFYAEHIDLFQDAQAVLKGSGESEYDDRVEYNFPYITNMLMPYYSLLYGSGTRKDFFDCVHRSDFYRSQAQSATPDFTNNSVGAFLNLLKGGKDIQFSVLGETKTIKFPYDVCKTDVWSEDYYNHFSDNQKATLSHMPIVAGRAHIGGLYEKIFGVVGDAPKAVNAEPVILYYLSIDYYYRAQQHIKPFVGRIKGVDKTIDEKMADFITEKSVGSLLSQFRINNNFFMFNTDTNIGEFKLHENYFVDGCVCNTWDENQSCLSRFINGNRLDFDTTTSVNSNLLDNIDSSQLYKLITYFNGGICPVLKHPDYFTMATIKPSSADPVQSPLSVVADGSLKVRLPDRITGMSSTSYNAYFSRGNTSDPFNVVPALQNDTIYSQFPMLYDDGLSGLLSIIDLRRSALMQTYYEKINANGFLFQDYMLAFFGQDIEDEHLRIPRLIGRASTTFDIIPVVQQSGKSSSDGSPLGTLAANAVANFSTGFIRFSCQMGGFVLANLSISGNNSYQEAYARWCFERGSLDQYNPHFLGIGDQAIMNYELFNPALQYSFIQYTPNNTRVAYTASENAWLNISNYVPFASNAVVFSVLNIESQSFKNAVNQAFQGFGFIPRRQELRTAFNKIGGNFKSRSDLITTINPSYSSAFVSGYFRTIDNPRNSRIYNGSILSSIGSLDVWTLSEDHDLENIFVPEDMDNIDIPSTTPTLSSAFLMASKPWQRLVEYNDVPPIYMSLNVIAHVVRTITAQSIQGQGVHL